MTSTQLTLILSHLTQAEVGKVVGASERTVRRWSTGVEPQARFQKPLADLHAVIDELADSLTARGVRQWMNARNRLLDSKRPIDLLGVGEVDKVRAAAAAFSEGVYV